MNRLRAVFAVAAISISANPARTQRTKIDTAAAHFETRLRMYGDSAETLLRVLPDSVASHFQARLIVEEIKAAMKKVGVVDTMTADPVHVALDTLSTRAQIAALSARPLIDALDSYHAPAGLDRMQDQMIQALRAAAFADDTLSDAAFMCRMETLCNRSRLLGALGSHKKALDAYAAARARVVTELAARGVAARKH